MQGGAQGAKVRTSISASWSGMERKLEQQLATVRTPPPQIRSGPARGPLECPMQLSVQLAHHSKGPFYRITGCAKLFCAAHSQ